MSVECPRCRGTPGTGTVEIETREFKEISLLTGRRTYLVRTVEVTGFCEPCSRAIQTGRLIAGAVSLAPLVGLFVVGVALDARALMLPLMAYGLYLASTLGYTWADWLIYGAELELRLAAFLPEGDPGSVRLPVGIAHCLLRIGVIPGAFFTLGFALVGVSSVMPRTPTPSVAASVAPSEPESADARLQQATNYLAAHELFAAVETDGSLQLHSRTLNGREYKVVIAYERPESVPAGAKVARMSGSSLVRSFLERKGYAALMVEGVTPPLKFWRYELQKMALPQR